MQKLDDLDDRLILAAQQARDGAYAPYSGYKVGAALLCENGDIISGCNVENRSYGATLCAERIAIARAVCLGHISFDKLAVVTDGDPPATPCGICLQVLAEFCKDLPILLANVQGRVLRTRLKNLLPAPFDFK